MSKDQLALFTETCSHQIFLPVDLSVMTVAESRSALASSQLYVQKLDGFSPLHPRLYWCVCCHRY